MLTGGLIEDGGKIVKMETVILTTLAEILLFGKKPTVERISPILICVEGKTHDEWIAFAVNTPVFG